MKKYLLVNPWIHDFAAHDFGLKPVGLLRIAGYLRRQGHKVYFVDCLGNSLVKRDQYGFGKLHKKEITKSEAIMNIDRPYFRYGISPECLRAELEKIATPDEIYVASEMTYWYPGVKETINSLRQRFPGSPITLGGIYARLCPGHARRHSGADQISDVDFLPADSFFEKGFYPAYDLLSDHTVLPIQLTRGCPFNCSYCASNIIWPHFEMRNPEHLFEEIIYWHKKFGTRNFIFYDDALIYRQDEGIKVLLKHIIDSGLKLTFHIPNGLHVHFITPELARLLNKANFAELRLLSLIHI
jgi:radical SAM superfamily enzyme YgiQ (UPF0313 family)